MNVSLTFYGAAGTVTGAKFLLEADRTRLLMECGLFQGLRSLKERNWAAPPVAPNSLAAVLLSHAHIDHSGYLPRLVRDGFVGTLLVEFTYGNRSHPADDGTPVIEKAVHRAVERQGVLLVPTFAVGRTQELLYLMRQLEEQGRIPKIPVHLDSPMGIAATAIYARHPDEHDTETRQVAASGRRPLVPANFHLSTTADHSKRLNGVEGPAIIIAGSGMATGGRILHHLRQWSPRPASDRALRGIPGRGDAGPRAPRRRHDRGDFPRAGVGAGDGADDRRAQRSRRPGRDREMAGRLPPSARGDLDGPRGAAGGGRAARCRRP